MVKRCFLIEFSAESRTTKSSRPVLQSSPSDVAFRPYDHRYPQRSSPSFNLDNITNRTRSNDDESELLHHQPSYAEDAESSSSDSVSSSDDEEMRQLSASAAASRLCFIKNGGCRCCRLKKDRVNRKTSASNNFLAHFFHFRFSFDCVPLDEVMASRAVFAIVSGTDGLVKMRLEPAK